MVKIELTVEQLHKAIKQLPEKDQRRLIEKVEHEAWQREFRGLLSRIRARVKKHPISQKDIDTAVQEARREIYARRRP